MVSIKTFRDLDIWKKGIELVTEVYKTTASFPSSELYGLALQMRRASVSVPSNVAEGFRRKGSKEFKHFLNIALGSLAELETQCAIAKELNYLKGDSETLLLEFIDHISRMITNLSKRL